MLGMIVITGGAGALGTAIHEHLERAEYESVALPSDQCDITDAGSVLEALAKYKPKVVVNCAAMTNVDKCERRPGDALHVNGVGPGIVASVAEASGVGVLHISTDYVFKGDKGPYRDTDIPFPINKYGLSKYFGEQSVQRLSSNYLIVRLGWLYGPEKPGSAPELAKLAATRRVGIWGDIQGTPTLLDDAAGHLATCAALGEIVEFGNEIVHCGPWMNPVSWYEFLVKDYPAIQKSKLPFGTPRPKKGGLIPSKGHILGQ